LAEPETLDSKQDPIGCDLANEGTVGRNAVATRSGNVGLHSQGQTQSFFFWNFQKLARIVQNLFQEVCSRLQPESRRPRIEAICMLFYRWTRSLLDESRRG